MVLGSRLGSELANYTMTLTACGAFLLALVNRGGAARVEEV